MSSSSSAAAAAGLSTEEQQQSLELLRRADDLITADPRSERSLALQVKLQELQIKAFEIGAESFKATSPGRTDGFMHAREQAEDLLKSGRGGKVTYTGPNCDVSPSQVRVSAGGSQAEITPSTVSEVGGVINDTVNNIARNILNLPPAIVRSIIGELRVYFSPSSSSSSSDRVEELGEDTTR